MSAYTRLQRCLIVAGALCLISFLGAELVLSARNLSPTWNEPDHLLAGLRYWQCSDFAINSEHPPLVKLLAAIPLLPLRLRIPKLPQGPSKLEANVAGREFLYANNAGALLFRARFAASILTLLLASLLFEAVYRIFGPGPAFLALALFVTEPNLLAHGVLVTTDMGLTCCLFAAVYAFYRYIYRRSCLRLLECGFTVGLAFAAKHSGILAIPILGLLAAAEIWAEYRVPARPPLAFNENLEAVGHHPIRLAAAFLFVIGIGLVVVWAFYGFRFRARPGTQVLAPSLAEAAQDLKHESRVILALNHWRVLPESYLYGLVDVLIGSTGPRPTFLFGKLYPHGRWFYFPAVLLIKSTLGFLLLLLASLLTGNLFQPKTRRELFFFALPSVTYLAFSMTSGLNLGVRHILPVYPFLLVLTAVGAWRLIIRHRGWGYLVAVLLALHVLSSWRAFPDYLAYSNEFWGGPARTYKVLSDSNVDWGQGLETARRYLEGGHFRDCWMAYFGTADPAHYQIPCKLLPDPFSGWWGEPVDVVPQVFQGTVLISATEIAGTYWGPEELNPYEQFLRTPPAANLGGSVLVFKGGFELTMASALGHASKASQLAANHRLDQALAEARTAARLAPLSIHTQLALGHVLQEAKQTTEARRAYQTALSLAQTVHPEYQLFWIPFLRKQLALLDRPASVD